MKRLEAVAFTLLHQQRDDPRIGINVAHYLYRYYQKMSECAVIDFENGRSPEVSGGQSVMSSCQKSAAKYVDK